MFFYSRFLHSALCRVLPRPFGFRIRRGIRTRRSSSARAARSPPTAPASPSLRPSPAASSAVSTPRTPTTGGPAPRRSSIALSRRVRIRSKFAPGITSATSTRPRPKTTSASTPNPPKRRSPPAPTGPIAGSTATFTFTATEPGTFQCRLDSTAPADWAPCTSPHTYSSLPDGPHTFEVRATDGVGNVDPTPATSTFTVDTEPPETTISSGPAGPIAGSTAAFTFTASEPGTFQCRLDSTAPADWAPCTSPHTYSSLPDGPHTFEVRATDGVGNVDPTPATSTFTVDTEPPETTISSGPAGPIAGSTAAFTFTASEPGTFQCRLDSTAPADWAPCTSPHTYSSLPDGPHTFEVRATDGVGNVDPTPATSTFTVDTKPPETSIASGPIAGESVDVETVEGVVELQCPGEDSYSKLSSFKQIPLGCLINTRNGTVNLTASKGTGEVQGGHFWGGVFIVSQKPGENQEVVLTLAGRRMCERRKLGNGRVRELSGKGGSGRKLWGSGKGNFKTSGNYGSATVRGTTWLVVDRCDSSTLFKVGEGTVWVSDFVTGKSLVLTTGQQYIAKAAIPRLNLGQ